MGNSRLNEPPRNTLTVYKSHRRWYISYPLTRKPNMPSIFHKRQLLEAVLHDSYNNYHALCITETWLLKTKADFVS